MTTKAQVNDQEIDEEKVITFTSGIMGFEQYKRYILLDHPGTDTVKWLQSIDDSSIALPVANPSHFYHGYKPKISKEDFLRLEIATAEEAIVLCVLTIPKDAKSITINLKAPIIINISKRLADQVIAENPEYNIREPLKLDKDSKDGRCESC